MTPWATVLGWDPGTTGAACVHLLDKRGAIQSTESIRFKASSDSDVIAFVREFSPDFAIVERVTSFGMGRTSSFKFGGAYRFAQGVLLTLGIPFDLVTAQKWQRPYSVPASEGAQRKRELKAIAQRTFPGLKLVLEDADAHLIAEIARRYYLDRTRMGQLGPV